MDSFVVSARKYRPASFDMVVGQQSITGTLKNAIKNNQLAQAFLFTGPRGVGKTTCARILAKTINCFHITDSIEACNECESCLSFNRSHSFNVHELDAASNNSVEGIRSLVDQVRIPPQVGKYKVYIIDEVHMLSTQAFNAFLKTLEEPPAYAKFILATTERHKIIPTILSRCQIFDFSRITMADITRQLQFVAEKEGIATEFNALHIIARKADGAMRDALSIFDQMVSFSGNSITYKQVIESLNVLDNDYYFRVTDLALEGKASDILLLVDEVIAKGFEGSDFITGFGEHLRDLLVSKDPATVKLIEASDDVRKKYLEQAARCPDDYLLQALEINSRADLQYKNSSNKRLTLELALLQVIALRKKKNITEADPGRIGLPDPKEVPSTHSEPAPQAIPSRISESADNIKDSHTLNPVEHIDTAPAVTPPVDTAPAVTPPAVTPPVVSAPVVTPPTEPLQKETSIPTAAYPSDEKKETTPVKQATSLPPGLSLKIFAPPKEEEIPDVEPEGEPEDWPADAISADRFSEVWKSLAESQREGSQGLFLAMTKYEPLLNKDGSIMVFLDNAIQDDLVQERKLELLSHLRKTLNNYSLQIETQIKDNGFVQKAYLPKEKFDKLLEKNPDLIALKNKLDLDFDY